MAINAAEEETVESLKQWWEENGKQLIILVVVGFAAFTSWLVWTNSQNASLDSASDMYEEILALAITDAGQPGTLLISRDSERIVELGAQLRSEHGDSTYAKLGSLFAAQQSVRNDDLDAAEISLQWILDNEQGGLLSDADEGLLLTTNLRLGRIILAKGDAERALALVNNLDPKTFEAGYSELRGDIYLAMGREVDARDAYNAAQQAGSNSDGLRMKLDELSNES
ncbi:MAG: tetratricopeptide repeat protein [Proteobacteria bacterium]|nr:tetratricopeptide repeat protein [Pseudomonadota bacterium]MDA1291573.1 tetratricopeptide repeat protein [Pseudomonadota bacterium]